MSAIDGDLGVLASLGFPKTAERIRQKLSLQRQSVLWMSDLYDQMDAERRKQDGVNAKLREECARLRSELAMEKEKREWVR